MTTLGILQRRFVGLGRDEDGVALVVTLAVFMFMYVVCMGVYAIGVAVREKVHLQNVCDAAAYSAAVVQADALSRIATINRAMSWTYVQMTRRQMDYITDKWLQHVIAHYNDDRKLAIDWMRGYGYGACHMGAYNISEVAFNDGAHRASVNEIVNAREACRTGVGNNSSASFYVYAADYQTRLENQIRADKAAIGLMNEAELNIVSDITRQMRESAFAVIRASAHPGGWRVVIRYCDQSSLVNDLGLAANQNAHGYFRQLRNNDYDESKFIGFCNPTRDQEDNVFSPGIDAWFIRSSNGTDATQNQVGIQRAYRRNGTSSLKAEWNWWSYHFKGDAYFADHVHWQVYCKGHRHGCYGDRGCKCTLSGNNHNATVAADCRHIYVPELYNGAQALPIVLRSNFFSGAGSIMIGICRRNRNPFGEIFNIGQGVYAAFNYFDNLGLDTWTWCFAAARAAYKGMDDVEDSRDYNIEWNRYPGQPWNLCQSDWDATLIPVRKMYSGSSGRAWDNGSSWAASTALNDWQSAIIRDAQTNNTAPYYLQPSIFGGGTADVLPHLHIPAVTISSIGDYSDPNYGVDGVQTWDTNIRWGIENSGSGFSWPDAANWMLH